MRLLFRRVTPLALAFAAALTLLSGGSAAAPGRADTKLVEVVVTLPQAPLALEVSHDRTLAAEVRVGHSLDARAPAALSYLRTLAATQRAFADRLAVSLPAASVYWHYSVALDGVAVVLPQSEVSSLSSIPGATVWPTVTYHSLSTRKGTAGKDNVSDALIGATQLWNEGSKGQGMKIGIIDDGVDQAHPFFDPSGYSYPTGFPMGNPDYTTPKVIVARAFPPPPGQTSWKNADLPFDPVYSDHASHVAGIAAGDFDTPTNQRGGVSVSGIAPDAYIGNYKVYTVPTPDYGLDGNSPEVAKGIDQAVEDGMNVINLSIGDPTVYPKRDLIVQALDNAAKAGVVPVVAAGNDYDSAGYGTINSPGNAPAAITVAASTEGGDGTRADTIGYFSSAGPDPISLAMKPDVTAPGLDILSAIPGGWESLDGTSMSAPHVAGGAALLLERHPSWTVEQVKSALTSTGDPVYPNNTSKTEVPPLREGGGRIDLVKADQPLIFTKPTLLGWGLVRRGFSAAKRITTADAGGGASPWAVTVFAQKMPHGATLRAESGTVVAGDPLTVRLKVSSTAATGDGTGFVVLTRGTDVRRIPFWFHVEVPKLQLDPHRTLTKPGVYHGDTAGKASRVSSYLYPELGLASGVPISLGGPEQVFRFTLHRQVANFGIVVTSHPPAVTVSPRLVIGSDENRLAGYTALPVALNPYQGWDRPEPAVAAVLPAEGTYEFVFDTPTGAKPGPFSFRFWVNDTTPPTIRLLDSTVTAGKEIRFAVHDSGSGVDPYSLAIRSGKIRLPFTYSRGILSASTAGLAAGKHKVTVTAADYQETKNMEDVLAILPNTRVLTATVTIRG